MLYVGTVVIAVLRAAQGNSADSVGVNRLAEINAHAHFVSTPADSTPRTPLVRTDEGPKVELFNIEANIESMNATRQAEARELSRFMFPMPRSDWQMQLDEPQKSTFSEDGEDMWLQPLFEGIHKGFFVESGAFDGEMGSNTLYFERTLGWTGLLVEPNPQNFPKLMKKGRQAFIFSGCLSDTLKQESFGDLDISKGEHGHITSAQDPGSNPVSVTCAPLPSVLNLIGRSAVDYWSLNVEGSEVRVLKGMDFDKVELGVLLVAAHRANEVGAEPEIADISDTMKAHGFQEFGRRISGPTKPVHIAFVNPKYFEKRGLPLPHQNATGEGQPATLVSKLADAMAMLNLAEPASAVNVDSAPNSTGPLANTTGVLQADRRVSGWAMMPLILVIAALAIACCVKTDVKGPSDV